MRTCCWERKHDENLLKNLVVVAPILVVKENRKVLAFSNFKKNVMLWKHLLIAQKEQGRKKLPSLIRTVTCRIEVSEVYLSCSAEHEEDHWTTKNMFQSVKWVSIVFAGTYTNIRDNIKQGAVGENIVWIGG